MHMARVKQDPETGKILGTEKKEGRAVRGITIRFPDAVTEVRFHKFVEDFDGTQPEALGHILKEYLAGQGY